MQGTLRLIEHAWEAYGDPRRIAGITEISANVSTNRVYRLVLEDDSELITKCSSYGSYVHFRQDHALIDVWARELRYTRYRHFLAPIVTKAGTVFTYREQDAWAVFYEKAPFYDFLPPRLNAQEVSAFGREMATLHLASAEAAVRMPPTWKSVGSDIATLFDVAGNSAWRAERGFSTSAEHVIRTQCELFLSEAERLSYHSMQRIPVLLDWNIGNFSVGLDQHGFKLFSRWDYDWFRIEPRGLDFYFCARVVRDEGDQEIFSYLTSPLTEPRFIEFLKAYHEENPLTDHEILFLKEAYRFFILNYVVRSGEHFFRTSICQRLQKEALEQYLPALEQLDLRPIADAVLGA